MRTILANVWDCSTIDRAIILSAIVSAVVAIATIILWK